MRARAALVLAALLGRSAPGAAQPPSAPRPAAVSVGLTVRADAIAAARQLSLRRNEIVRCFDLAAARAADRLAALRVVRITLRLDRRGRATEVVVDPPLLSPGLSECLAQSLLAWDQGGRPGARAMVRLLVTR